MPRGCERVSDASNTRTVQYLLGAPRIYGSCSSKRQLLLYVCRRSTAAVARDHSSASDKPVIPRRTAVFFLSFGSLLCCHRGIRSHSFSTEHIQLRKHLAGGAHQQGQTSRVCARGGFSFRIVFSTLVLVRLGAVDTAVRSRVYYLTWRLCQHQ